MTEQIQDPRYGHSFVAKRAAVASPNKLATVIGNNILHQGGNAIDAMVAVNAALGVVFPHMTGAGGDSFWLIYLRFGVSQLFAVIWDSTFLHYKSIPNIIGQ